jgi:hypothetical protein
VDRIAGQKPRRSEKPVSVISLVEEFAAIAERGARIIFLGRRAADDPQTVENDRKLCENLQFRRIS